MQQTLDMIQFGEQLFTAVRKVKHPHNLLGVCCKVGESFSWNLVVLTKIEDMVDENLDFKSSEH